MSKTDEKLVEDYLTGDENALRLLFKKYINHVYNFVFGYVKNRGDAEDITQDTLMKAWKSLSKFDKSKKFKTWLFEIAKNTSLNWIKKKKPVLFGEFKSEENQESLEESLEDTWSIPEEIFERKDSSRKVFEAVDRLNVNYRQILILYYKEHFNFREISEITGQSVNTVKSGHRRAILSLKKLLLDKNAPKRRS